MMQKIFKRLKQLGRRLLGREPWYRPQVRIETERHGSDYGGWAICPTLLPAGGRVYSFGIGEDISFDLSLIENYDVELHAFDPTPRSIEWVRRQTLPPRFHLIEVGLADYDGDATFFPPEDPGHISHSMLTSAERSAAALTVPVRRLASLLDEFGHETVDLLKMDVEGAEYAILSDVVSLKQPIPQLLVEFHHRFSNVNVDDTRNAVQVLNQHGYLIAHVALSGDEYTFIHQTAL